MALIVLVAASDSSAGSRDVVASPPGLYVFDASSALLKPLIASEKERQDLRWSPDGAWIASQDTADFLIDVIAPSGGTPRDLESVEWSRTGSRVAYATAGGLFVGPSSWTNATRVTRARDSDPIDWAPSEGRLTFGKSAMRIARADGKGARKLWAPPSDGPNASWINNTAWSPSGRQIAIEATVNNGVASRKGGVFLYLVTPGRRGARKIPIDGPLNDLRGWSGDGKWLLMGYQPPLLRVPPRGGRVQLLCPNPCVDAELSSDLRRVAFVTGNEDTGPSTLWVSNVDGSDKRRITDAPGPMWVDWSRDGRTLGLTFVNPDGEHASVATADLETGEIRQLTVGTHADVVYGGLSFDGSSLSFARVDQKDSPELWVIGTHDSAARKVMSLASDPDLGACPEAAWSPTAPALAITNAACEPS